MVRLRDDNITTLGSDNLSEVNKLLQAHRPSKIQPLFGDTEIPGSVKAHLEQTSGKQLADLNLYYKIVLRESKDAVENFIDSLNSLPIVEIAYPLSKPAPAPSTPDFESSQGYLDSAPGGIDARYSWSVTAGTGSGVKIVDVEYSWNLNHEDLSKARNALMEKWYWSPSDPFNNNNHGTAVLGELIADDNGFGVTGIAKGAAIGVVPCNILIWGYVLAESIQFAADNLQAWRHNPHRTADVRTERSGSLCARGMGSGCIRRNKLCHRERHCGCRSGRKRSPEPRRPHIRRKIQQKHA